MRKSKKTVHYFKVILLVIIALFLVRVAQQGYTLYRVHRETIKTEAKVKALEEEKAALEKEKASLGDINYIEKIAREDQNMVKKNEIPLFIIDDKDKDKSQSKQQEKNNAKK